MSEGGVMSEDCHEGCLKAEHSSGRNINEYQCLIGTLYSSISCEYGELIFEFWV